MGTLMISLFELEPFQITYGCSLRAHGKVYCSEIPDGYENNFEYVSQLKIFVNKIEYCQHNKYMRWRMFLDRLQAKFPHAEIIEPVKCETLQMVGQIQYKINGNKQEHYFFRHLNRCQIGLGIQIHQSGNW